MAPLRATTTTAPGMFLASISAWMTGRMRAKRSAEKPLEAGEAVGMSAAISGEAKPVSSKLLKTALRQARRPLEKGCRGMSRSVDSW